MPLVNTAASNKHHYFNNGGHHHHQRHQQPAVALPRSLQQQQQQQQAEQNLQVNLNSPSHSATAVPSHYNGQQHYQRGSRGTKELGMLVMLLTAEAVLLSGASTPSSLRSGVGMSVSSLSKAFQPSNEGNKMNNNNNNKASSSTNTKVSTASFDASCGSSAIASDSNRESGNVSPTAAQEQQQQKLGTKTNSGAETPSHDSTKGSVHHHHLQGTASPPSFFSSSSADDSASSHDDDDVIEVVENNNSVKDLTFLNSIVIIGNSKSAKKMNVTQELLNHVFEYLPWRDASIARGTSKAWQFACSSINCLFFNLPKTSIPAVFVYSQSAFTADEEVRIEPRFQHKSELGKWKCEACSFVNSETRILCGSRTCQMPIPTHRSAARLFAGQLRREGSVPYLRWLFEDIIGSDKHVVRIKNVENHRDANTMRGKGCCWVYLEDLSMANPAVDMHHRLYSDVGPDGREGVWVVPEHCRGELDQEIDQVSYIADRPRALPRGSLVVERPVMTPQMAPEKATISAKVAASHSAYSPTTNTTSYTNAAVATASSTGEGNNNNNTLLSSPMEQQHFQVPHHHIVANATSSSSAIIPVKMLFQNAELVQVSSPTKTSSQSKRFSHNPYAFIIREKQQQQSQEQVEKHNNDNQDYNSDYCYYAIPPPPLEKYTY